MTRAAAVTAVVWAACLGLAAPVVDAADRPRAAASQPGAGSLTVPESLDRPPAGYVRTGLEVSRIAARVPAIRSARADREDTYARPYLKGRREARRWQVSFYAPSGTRNEQIGQVLIDDASGRVIEAWTGYKVAWTMARGYPGAFGRAVNAPYVWIGLCLFFVLPFARRPLRLLHLDLAILLAFSVPYALVGAAAVDVAVPLTYPLLIYVLLRALGMAVARSKGWSPAVRVPLRLTMSRRLLLVALLFLIGFRVGLNLMSSNVIDVGYASVIGADRVLRGDLPYGAFPADNPRGDTYGPVAYYAYAPFEALFPWSGQWDDLPAAHAAAVTFDLACVALLFLVGSRVRGAGLGLLLAYAWTAYPFTLLVSASNSNDSLVALLVLVTLLVVARPVPRGVALAFGGLTKFAPLALGPLLATYRGGIRAGQWSTGRALGAPAVATTIAAVLAGAALLGPILLGGRWSLFYERTLGFQAGRGSPFSVWGLYGIPGREAATFAAGLLALVVAFAPRRRDVVVVAALGVAVLVAVQLSLAHWFPLYIVWFLPLLLVALLAPYAEPDGQRPPSAASPDQVTAPRAAAPALSRPRGEEWTPG